MTFILAPAAAVVPAAVPATAAAVPAAAAAVRAAAVAVPAAAAAGTARAPMTCSSELNKLPRRFCVDPEGVAAAELLEESAVGSNGEPFLWPWP